MLWSFQDMPVQVGAPCPVCGGLFWWVTGREPIAPSGYCLNCRPGAIGSRPALHKIVAESLLDELPEESDAEPLPDEYQL